MNVDVDIKNAKRKRNLGLAIGAVAGLFILVSGVYGIHGMAMSTGSELLAKGTNFVYQHTQVPVLSTIWQIAPQPDFSVILDAKNLTFAGLVLVFAIAAGMRLTGSITLQRIAKAQSDAQEENWKEEFKARKK